MQLARILALALALVVGGLAWLGVCAYGFSWKAALVVGLGLVVGVTVVVCATFAIALPHAAPRPPALRVGFVRTLVLVLREVWCSARVFFVDLFTGGPGLSASVLPRAARHAVPVLLIHGYVNNEAAMRPLWKRLSDKGFQAFTHTMEPVFGDIDAYADGIDARIDAVLQATGAPRVAVIAHSMGGLAMRAWARRVAVREGRTAARVAQLITLGTPHHGTALAPFGFGLNAQQMRLDSTWHAALPDATALPFPVTTIFSYDDNIVAPQTSSLLKGATQLAFSGIGHLTLLNDAAVFAAIESLLTP